MRIENQQQLATALGDRTMYGMTSREFGWIIVQQGLWTEAMELALRGGKSGTKGQVAFRAAWSLEAAYLADSSAFRPYVERFIEDFTQVRNPSVHRHYTKMLFDMMRRGMVWLTDAQAEAVAEFCFDRLIGMDTRIAVKVWAMDILALLALRLEWIGENLEQVLQQQMGDGTPGLVSRGRKVLRQLEAKPATRG